MASDSPFVVRHDIRHLNVPPRAATASSDFMASALWSVIQYFTNDYPDPGIRRGIVQMAIDDIRDTISPTEGGWRPKQSKLTQLSSQVNALNFSLDAWPVSAPQVLTKIAEDEIEKYCPLIAFVDGYQLQTDNHEPGPIYSVVIAGVGDERSIVVDPWYGIKQDIANQKLESIWDQELHQIVKTEPVISTPPTVNTR